ncbi:hypothetical protein [Undibacterium terreum]|uniref:Uncharacterized protein n=1 Tax=Undibacterium terreum TaxID=1224302 RepID=A0A916UIM2_9BURK|nr:hypothetical protein [Undibacterium terreum]GGC72328.1 hypothetical protein GCM10011396_19320 [Undibacterium terreum]
MKLSQFFEALASAYDAELEDLRSDSEGNDILRKRLMTKRGEVPLLLPMLKSNPEMIAVAFHGGMKFLNPLVLEVLASKEPNRFPSWKELKSSVVLEAWAEKLSAIVLDNVDGDQFMVTAACLEYLNKSGKSRANSPSNVEEHEEEDEDDSEANEGRYHVDTRNGSGDEYDEDQQDLEEAGADWLVEQGFDRKD